MTVAKQKAGVYDKVLECAKEEFLSKGFLDASLRIIAQAADTSTGSIYTRFGDKEGLFRAIAEPVVDQFKAMFCRVQEDFHQLSEEEQRADMGQYTAHHQEEMLDYIYDHFDVFRLLLDGAHGTRFSCFLDELGGPRYQRVHAGQDVLDVLVREERRQLEIIAGQLQIGLGTGAALILGLAESAPLTAEEVAVTGKGQFSRGLQNLVRPAVQVILGNLKRADVLASGLIDGQADGVDVVDAVEQLQSTEPVTFHLRIFHCGDKYPKPVFVINHVHGAIRDKDGVR